MTVVSEVVEVPASMHVKIKPKSDRAWRITSLVTGEECGIRFRTDTADDEDDSAIRQTKLLVLDDDDLKTEIFINDNNYIIFEALDQNRHTAFFSAKVTS